jgi:hypothetical protein
VRCLGIEERGSHGGCSPSGGGCGGSRFDSGMLECRSDDRLRPEVTGEGGVVPHARLFWMVVARRKSSPRDDNSGHLKELWH